MFVLLFVNVPLIADKGVSEINFSFNFIFVTYINVLRYDCMLHNRYSLKILILGSDKYFIKLRVVNDLKFFYIKVYMKIIMYVTPGFPSHAWKPKVS